MQASNLLLITLISAVTLVGCGKQEEAVPTVSVVAAVPSAPTAANLLGSKASAGNLAKASAESANATPASLPPVELTESEPLGGKGRELTPEEVQLINYGIYMFKEEKGRFPATLDEAVKLRYIARLPELPAGSKYQYNAQAGSVSVSKN